MRLRFISGSMAAGVLLLAGAVHAQDDSQTPPFSPPCEGAVWWAESDASREDFDFWVGEWQVFDRESGLMVGFDDVEKVFGGCALRQRWRHMNDVYTIAGASWRMQGGSHTALGADGLWHQTWIDNNGSRIPMAGQLDDNGVMVLQSDWIEYADRSGNAIRVRHRWHWDPQDDGTIHNWGFQQTESPRKTDWVKYYDIVYRRNAPGGPSAIYRLPQT